MTADTETEMRVLNLARDLLRLPTSSHGDWYETDADGEYLCTLPNLSILISLAYDDNLRLIVLNEKGETVDDLVVAQPRLLDRPNESALYSTLQDLYRQAKREAKTENAASAMTRQVEPRIADSSTAATGPLRAARLWRTALLSIGFAGTAAVVAWIATHAIATSALSPANAATALVAFVSIITSIVTLVRVTRLRQQPKATLDEAADHLAHVVAHQWSAEAVLRYSDGRLLPRWQLDPRSASDLWDISVESTDLRSLGGDASGVSQLLSHLRRPQLAVLGAPGSGKTTLLVKLTLDLLRTRPPGGVVPVLLTFASWDPTSEPFDLWLARQLASQYPDLTRTTSLDENTAIRLVESRRILPILDGLDELPQSHRFSALLELRKILIEGQPIVFSCRTAEYADLLSKDAIALAAVPMIEILPISSEDAVNYLIGHGPAGEHERWLPVIRYLHDYPQGPLAAALSTPLMVSLARSIYGYGRLDPSELLDTSRYPYRGAIEDRLLDNYVAVAYAQGHDSGRPFRRSAVRFSPQEARRWLHFLAVQLDRRANLDVAWWDISPQSSRMRLTRVLASFAIGVLCGLIISVASGLSVGLAGGTAVTLLSTTISIIAPRTPQPRRLDLGYMDLIKIVAKRVGPGLVAGLALGLSVGAWIGAAGGVSTGLIAGFAVAIWLNLGEGLGSTVSVSDLASPPVAIRLDRVATLWSMLILAGLSGLSCAAILALVGMPGLGAAIGITVALVVILAAAFNSASTHLLASIFWGAAAGKFPWRFMRFLADARARGVLRQVGGVYQFRPHALQRRLARSELLDRQQAL